MKGIYDAMILAIVSHNAQEDEKGLPYIYHPIRVMNAMELDDEDGRIVAILHDVVEDTGVTLTDLDEFGFSSSVVDSIGAITKVDGESYDQYLVRVKGDWTATRAKIEDAKDNLARSYADLDVATRENDLSGMGVAHRRTKKYIKAINFLEAT